MYDAKSLDTEILVRWSKLVEYDFFRIYNHHLILYSPQAKEDNINKLSRKKSGLPQFHKHIYTKELIDFVLKKINSNEMTKIQVINEYRIPKTTLYKWIQKNNNVSGSEDVK